VNASLLWFVIETSALRTTLETVEIEEGELIV
jgi:hypothetical protein